MKDVVVERAGFGLLKVQNFSFLTAAASDSPPPSHFSAAWTGHPSEGAPLRAGRL